MSDTGFKIIFRAGISVAGCVAVSGLLKGIVRMKPLSKIMGGGSPNGSEFNGGIPCTLSASESYKASDNSSAHNTCRESCGYSELCYNGEPVIDNNGAFIEKSSCKNNSLWRKMILFSGKNSLEIYLLHGLLLNILKLNGEIYFNSVVGILTVLGNYLITVILCLFIIKILNNNRVLNKILWAKK